MKRKMMDSIGHSRSKVVQRLFGRVIKQRIYIMENGCTAEGKFLYSVLSELDKQRVNGLNELNQQREENSN